MAEQHDGRQQQHEPQQKQQGYGQAMQEKATEQTSAAAVAAPQVRQDALCLVLADREVAIEKRVSALFGLRNLSGPGPVGALVAAMRDPSVLLAHEAAFALGQMGDASAVPALTAVLADTSLHPIVRHEAAEALGNLGGPSTLSLLRHYLSDDAPEVRETCHLAVRRLEDVHGVPHADADGDVGPTTDAASAPAASGGMEGNSAASAAATTGGSSQQAEGSSSSGSRFVGVDPAGSSETLKHLPAHVLRRRLLDEGLPLYQRYGALFALRDTTVEKQQQQQEQEQEEQTEARAAAQAVIEALHVCGSALLRHEVAYVLGQMRDKASVEALMGALDDDAVHPMVRHEAAVALGSVADTHKGAEDLLRRLQRDPEPIVAESCRVALDMLGLPTDGVCDQA